MTNMQAITNTLQALSTINTRLNRHSIEAFEQFAEGEDQIECPVTHTISGGMYARQITIPEDTFLTGQMYKYDHIDIMVSGKMVVSTDDGITKILEGFNIFPSKAGKKRAGYALAETVWVTITSFPQSNLSGDEIQAEITVDGLEEFEEFMASISRYDYERFLGETGLTEEQIRRESECKTDMAEFADGDVPVEVRDSKIEGKGLFASAQFEAGTSICAARFHGFRTLAGRYCNHSIRPNCQFVIDTKNESIVLVAVDRIHPDDELTVSYRETLSMRSKAGDLCQE